MELQYGFWCNAANFTVGNRVNALGIGGRLASESFPARMAALTVVFAFRFDAMDAGTIKKLRVRLIDAGGGEIAAAGDQEIRVGEPDDQARVPGHIQISNFLNVTFQAPGDYEARAEIDGVNVGAVPVTLVEPSGS